MLYFFWNFLSLLQYNTYEIAIFMEFADNGLYGCSGVVVSKTSPNLSDCNLIYRFFNRGDVFFPWSDIFECYRNFSFCDCLESPFLNAA